MLVFEVVHPKLLTRAQLRRLRADLMKITCQYISQLATAVVHFHNPVFLAIDLENRGKPIAAAASFETGPKGIHIGYLCGSGGGSGTQLMMYAESWARKRGYEFIELQENKKSAGGFYNKLGFSRLRDNIRYRKVRSTKNYTPTELKVLNQFSIAKKHMLLNYGSRPRYGTVVLVRKPHRSKIHEILKGSPNDRLELVRIKRNRTTRPRVFVKKVSKNVGSRDKKINSVRFGGGGIAASPFGKQNIK